MEKVEYERNKEEGKENEMSLESMGSKTYDESRVERTRNEVSKADVKRRG